MNGLNVPVRNPDLLDGTVLFEAPHLKKSEKRLEKRLEKRMTAEWSGPRRSLGSCADLLHIATPRQ